jgi:hypothetical protein
MSNDVSLTSWVRADSAVCSLDKVAIRDFEFKKNRRIETNRTT